MVPQALTGSNSKDADISPAFITQLVRSNSKERLDKSRVQLQSNDEEVEAEFNAK